MTDNTNAGRHRTVLEFADEALHLFGLDEIIIVFVVFDASSIQELERVLSGLRERVNRNNIHLEAGLLNDEGEGKFRFVPYFEIP
jgi:hypothetical protein